MNVATAEMIVATNNSRAEMNTSRVRGLARFWATAILRFSSMSSLVEICDVFDEIALDRLNRAFAPLGDASGLFGLASEEDLVIEGSKAGLSEATSWASGDAVTEGDNGR